MSTEQILRLVDGLARAKAKRADLYGQYKKAGDELELIETALVTFMRDEFNRTGKVPTYVTADARSNDHITATLDKTELPVAEDWEAVYAHIKATGEFDLMHKRLNLTAVRERWAENEVVPGVKPVEQYGVKLTVKSDKQRSKKQK